MKEAKAAAGHMPFAGHRSVAEVWHNASDRLAAAIRAALDDRPGSDLSAPGAAGGGLVGSHPASSSRFSLHGKDQ
jgi:hypothetical protein